MDEDEDDIEQVDAPAPAEVPAPIAQPAQQVVERGGFAAFQAALVAAGEAARVVNRNVMNWGRIEEADRQVDQLLEEEEQLVDEAFHEAEHRRLHDIEAGQVRPRGINWFRELAVNGGVFGREIAPRQAVPQPALPGPYVPYVAYQERVQDPIFINDDDIQRAAARLREQLNVPDPFNEEDPRAVGNDMNYDQLVRRFPALTDRYLPDLSNRNNAARALQQFDLDQSGNAVERDLERNALTLYLAGHAQAANINYAWCAECEMMIGFENHTHCPFCTYAMVERGEGEARGSHHRDGCANCGECCRVKGHQHCPSCDAHMERGCRYCGKCAACCACVLCTVAGCQYMQECEDCKKCYEHCTCVAVASSDPTGKIYPAGKPSERRQFDSERLSGIEWEYNRAADTRAMDHWCKKWRGHIHRDDSCGFEAVSAPVAGDYMVRCITSLGKVLTRATIDDRCSIHTHVDAKDLQWTDMFRFLDLYARVEPILYMIAGQERLDNRYAVPIGKEYAVALKRVDRKDAIMAVAFCPLERDGRKHTVTTMPDHGRNSQREKPGRRADNHQYCRRKGLNILPWLAGRGPRPQTPINAPVKAGDTLEKLAHRHGVSVAALMRWNKVKPGGKLGKTIVINKRTLAPDTTVEFRIHPNTHDPIRVINWVKMVNQLVEWAATKTDKDLESLPKSPLRILCEHVVPECAPWIMARVKEWRKETARNIGRQARRITIKGGKYVY
jgi:hypothetical protein